MDTWKRLVGGVAFAAMSSALVQPAYAQVTTSGVSGTVLNADGTPASSATVTVTDTRTGSTRSMTTGSSGAFDLRGLNVGGPYTVAVEGPGQQPTRVEQVFLNLGSSTDINLQFSGAAARDVIVVTASASNTAPVAIGPSVTFNLEDLQSAPSVNRDLKDIVRMDPRIWLDESNADAIQCAGANPRFNSLTVDGIGLNDGFGLNANGYPTERMPFPFDAVSQVSVELAPFDVQYGGFSACNINAVTKSGTNTFHGSAFYDYTDNDLRGDTIEGTQVFVPEYDEKRYGATLSGPIIPNVLFFSAAYEKTEGQNLFFRGPTGSGATNEIPALSLANYNRIVQISNDVYGYDPGGIPAANPAVDEKYLARLDWNINDRHRASLTYNFNEGLNLTESDSNPVTQFELSKHLYNRGAILKAYSGQVFSDWTDNFSTELRVSYNDVDFTQACVDGGNVGEVQVRVGAATVFLGCDDSRHSNDLDYTVLGVKAGASYQAGDHLFSAGLERQEFDIFNLFVQHTEGEYVFTSIDNFESGLASTVFYGNARGTNNPSDAAATFGYETTAAYLQDEFPVGDSASVTLGLRYDYYTSDDTPPYNANFEARNGFANTATFDGKGVLQPRFGFTWDIADRLTMRGGAGLFSGGNPNVWLSNSYSNDGITNIQLEYRNPGTGSNPLISNLLTGEIHVGDERGGTPTINPGGALWGVPADMFNAVTTATANGGVNAVDPDFEIPSEWKFALGFTYDFDLPGVLGTDYTLTGDFLRSQSKVGVTVVDNTLVQIGTAPDGRPLYRRVDKSSPLCATSPLTCPTRSSSQNDLILTNAEGGFQNVLSLALAKSYDFGLDWSLAYAHVQAEDTNSMPSSVAFSNWTGTATQDINNLSRGDALYEIPDRITATFSYAKAFFGDYETRATLFGQSYQGRPASFTFDNNTFTGANFGGDASSSTSGMHLLYVPSGPGATDDPLVSYAPGFDLAGFNAYIERYGLRRGEVASRSDYEGQWTTKFDLKVEQEFPVAFGSKGSAYVMIENIGNMLNDDWGVVYQAPFPQRTEVVSLNSITGGQYVYGTFLNNAPETRDGNLSFWTVRVGAKLSF